MVGALIFRRAALADAGAIAEIYAPYVQGSAISFEIEAPDAAEIGRRMTAIMPRYPYIVAEHDGRVVGYAYATELYSRLAYRWAAETTIYLSATHQAIGLGRALYEKLLAEMKTLGFKAAFGKITLPNPASVGLHERMGFRQSGLLTGVGYKQGRWYDVGIYQLDLAERPDTPAETLPPV